MKIALEEDIPITDPAFYSSEILCPDSLIAHIFRPAPQSTETVPLLQERMSIMREVGFILCTVGHVHPVPRLYMLIDGRALGAHSKALSRSFIEGMITKEPPLIL